jgi:hypothetical protein
MRVRRSGINSNHDERSGVTVEKREMPGHMPERGVGERRHPDRNQPEAEPQIPIDKALDDASARTRRNRRYHLSSRNRQRPVSPGACYGRALRSHVRRACRGTSLASRSPYGQAYAQSGASRGRE